LLKHTQVDKKKRERGRAKALTVVVGVGTIIVIVIIRVAIMVVVVVVVVIVLLVYLVSLLSASIVRSSARPYVEAGHTTGTPERQRDPACVCGLAVNAITTRRTRRRAPEGEGREYLHWKLQDREGLRMRKEKRRKTGLEQEFDCFVRER